MKRSTIFPITCIVLLCAIAAAAQENTAAQTTIANLESTVTAGTATRAEQLDLARAYIDAGRYYEAKTIAQRLADDDPSDTDAAGVRDRASAQLQLIAQQRVNDAELAMKGSSVTDAERLELANAYSDAGRYRDAAKIYSELSDPSYDVRLKHARALSWGGRHDDAERIYAKLAAEKQSPELDLEYGRVLSWMGARRASVERLEQAHKATNSEETAIALADAYTWSGDRDSAIRVLNDYSSSHANALRAKRQLADLQSSPELQIERLDRKIAADEFNLALHAERARLLYDAGHYARALSEIEYVREHSNGVDSVPDLSDLERQANERRKEEIAKLDERRRNMNPTPMTSSATVNTAQAEETLELAKAYAGLAAYDQSIDLYQDYLKMVPDDTTARLNYARVLSWDRRYEPSQAQYEIVLREYPDRSDLRLEYAQALSYDGDYVPAVAELRTLSDSSGNPRAYLYPDVPQRAHFNLGQIYRWYGWRDHAVAEQNSALQLDGNYVDAQRELERARYGHPGTWAEVRYTQETNSNDFQSRRGDIEGEHWLNPRLAVQGSVGRHNFDQAGISTSANVASGGAAWRQTDQLTFRGRVGLTFWDQGLGTRPFFGVGATWLPNLQSRAAVDYNHYDLVYDVSNVLTLAEPFTGVIGDPLSIDDLRAHYDWDSGGRLALLGDASYGFISDDNRRTAAHGLVSFRLLDSPFVAVKADGRVLSYDFRTNRYWSPDDYSSLAGVVQVGQDINDRVFWTAEFKAGKSWEHDRSSDIRALAARVTVPVGDTFDVVGSYQYGRSGRFESLIGDPELTNYWQRSWYVGVRLKQLFGKGDNRSRDRYYFDNRVLGSDIVPPEVR